MSQRPGLPEPVCTSITRSLLPDTFKLNVEPYRHAHAIRRSRRDSRPWGLEGALY